VLGVSTGPVLVQQLAAVLERLLDLLYPYHPALVRLEHHLGDHLGVIGQFLVVVDRLAAALRQGLDGLLAGGGHPQPGVAAGPRSGRQPSG
jgi:hypothetical protein